MISKRALDLILSFEGMDQPSAWPGEKSGISLGRGYDLGYVTREEFRAAWGPWLSPVTLSRLERAIGVRGEAARKMSPAFAGIVISREAADQVFIDVTLPKFEALTARAFPGVERLPEDARGALVSLVFNRGASMGDPKKPKDWKRRQEMRAVKTAVARGDLPGIAVAIRAMKRLWPKSPGLRERRDAEADLVESVV